MADVNAQSVEDFGNKVVYRYPAGRYAQTLTTVALAISTGLKTCVNSGTSYSYVIPATGLPSIGYKITWLFKTCIQVYSTTLTSSLLLDSKFIKYSASSLNYDGKPLQTEFYEEKTENVYVGQQLRAINIGNISVEPITSFLFESAIANYNIDFNSSVTGIVAMLQPVVTAYKK